MILVALLCTVLASPPAGSPPPRVLLLSSPTAAIGPSLLDSARVQLAGVAEVGPGPALIGAALSDRVAEAAALAGDSPGLIVWLEQTAADGEFVLFAVNRNRERALIQVVRLPVASEAERDRVVAVKIALLVEAGLPAATLALEPDPAPGRRPAAAAPPAPIGRAERLFVEAGMAGGWRPGDRQLGLQVGIGARARRGRLTGEALVGAWQAGGLEFAGPAGDVLLEETDLLAGGRLLAAGAQVAGGAWLEARVRLLDARGTASDGATGSAVRAVPTIGGGLELRWMPRPQIAIRGAVGVDVAPRPHRFLIDSEEVAKTGRVRGVGTVSAVISLPW